MNEIARIDSISELMTIGKAMSASGYFNDAKDANQAIVKILAGREMGFGPFAAMSDIHIIQGKPVVGANLMAAAVKSHPRYDYRVTVNTDVAVEICFYQEGKSIGVSTFTMDDAKAAGLQGKDNWRKFPRNMLFARAISNGVRWYCPDVFSGAAVYTPDEIDAEVVEVVPTQKRQPQPTDSISVSNAPDTDDPFGDELDDTQPSVSDNTDYIPTGTTPEPEPTKMHWIDKPGDRNAFWGWVHQVGLSNTDVYKALGTQKMHEYTGTFDQAQKAILDWQKAQLSA